jgi:3-hydroxyisobutyrate dehydrogenase-like beta-hydroxyacid dehydrogenase
MAANLRQAGSDLIVWNRTRATADAFAAEHGATVASTPAELGAAADVVFTMVVNGTHVRNLLLGPDGVATAPRPGLLCVDCSTIGPSITRAIGQGLRSRGVAMLDAPVTGSSPRAEDGTLTFMVGGDSVDLERVRPLLDVMGSLTVHAGPLGHGQMIKLINNAVAAINAAVVGEALLVGAGTGVDLDALTQVMGAGSGASTMLALKASPMRIHDYTPLLRDVRSSSESDRPRHGVMFKLDHMLKDVRLCLEEAETAGVPFEFAERVRAILETASELGHGDNDFAALIDPLERAAGVDLAETSPDASADADDG